MAMMIGLVSRSFLVLVLIISLRVIGFSWMQTSLLVAISLLLPVVNPSRTLARLSIGLVLIWSIAIALGAAPTYPDLSKGLVSLSQFEVPQVIQNGIPKVQKGLSEMISNPSRRNTKDNDNPREANTQELHGNYGEQMQAVDLLVRSGAIQQDDAIRLRKEISDRALRHLVSQNAPSD